MARALGFVASRLSPEQARFTAAMVGSFGTGQHAYPTPANLDQFAEQYVVDCLDRSINSRTLTRTGRVLAIQARHQLTTGYVVAPYGTYSALRSRGLL